MKICVTGGIATGKSTICKYFEDKGYFVFYSDIEAKHLANNNNVIKQQIIKIFGEKSYINNEYNVDYIRDIVFKNKSKLKLLDNLFKKVVTEKYKKQSLVYSISFFETALVFEHNLQSSFDLIIGVYCEKNEVIKRLKKRNNFNESQINKIIDAQLNNKEKMKKCSIIIDTTNGINYKKLNLILNYFEKIEERRQKNNYGKVTTNIN